MSLSPYIRIPCGVQVEARRDHPVLQFKGDENGFGKRIVVQTCETQTFDSVARAMEEGNRKQKAPDGAAPAVNKNILAHYGALFKNGMTDIAIKDVPKEETGLLLNYMYKGRMEIDSVATLRVALRHAVRFNMGSLLDGILDAFDFKQRSVLLLYRLGNEFGIPRFEAKAVQVLQKTLCSPRFPKKLLAAVPHSLMSEVLQGDLIVDCESEVLGVLLEYLKMSGIRSGEAVNLLEKIRFPHLTISDLIKLGCALKELEVEIGSISNFMKLKSVENILDPSMELSDVQLKKRGVAPRVCCLWLEKRYREDKDVLIINEANLTRQEKAHAHSKLKLNAQVDKLDSPDSFEMVTIGTQIFVDLKDNEFPSRNIHLQAFSISPRNELIRLPKGRIPLNFAQEVSNKRLTADGSRLILSFNLSDKKKQVPHVGYFETLPQLDRASFNEVKLPAELKPITVATLRASTVYALTEKGLYVVNERNEVQNHEVSLPGYETRCIDLIIKENLAFVYSLCYSYGPSYEQKDIVTVFDMKAGNFLRNGSDILVCEIPELSDTFLREYSQSFRRQEPREWHPRGSNSEKRKVFFPESHFRFFDIGCSHELMFVWTDSFNATGRVFYLGTLNFEELLSSKKPAPEQLRACVQRKVFYTKSDTEGDLLLSRHLIGCLPNFLIRSENRTWLETKLLDVAKEISAENLVKLNKMLGCT